jgi:putative ABC transport system permease protein
MIIETFLQDLRIGLRVLIKEKSFCALAVFVLALGICAVTTQFSVVNGVMLRGFSFPNADRLVSVQFNDPTSRTFFGVNNQIFALDFQDLLAEQKSLEHMGAYINGSTVNMTIGTDAQRFTGAYISDGFMKALGVTPFLGRDFTPADNQPGAAKVTIIGYDLWQRNFGGASDIIGRSVRLNGKPATVIGVMPKGFAFPANEQLWIPVFNEFPPQARNSQNAAGAGVQVLASLKPGVSIDQAQLEFAAFAKRFSETYPDTNKVFNQAEVETLIKNFTPRGLQGQLLVMLAFCLLVLLLACVNVMNMQFGRATLRAKELAIRSSLGATRVRLIRQMLTESLLVAILGAALGIGASYWTVDFLDATTRNLDNPPPAYITFAIDGKVLAFTVAATLLAAIVSGLVPALLSSRASASDVLKESGRGNTGRGVMIITRGLVVVQILVTSILLIGALLQLRSILNQQNLDYGYDTGAVLGARMGLMEGDYPTSAARKLFYDRLLQQLRSNPAIESAALSNRFRMVFSGNSPIEVEGKTYKEEKDRPNTNFEQVSDGFFGVTGQKLLEGRDFNEGDLDSKLPVAVVNAYFARKHFGNESAVGRRFRLSLNNGASFTPWRTIIGVVSTVRMLGPFNNPNVDDAGYYVPFYAGLFNPTASAEPVAPQFGTIAVRPRGGQRGEALLETLRLEVKKADGNLPLYFVSTPKVAQAVFTGGNRIIGIMFSIFGAVATVLAAVGLYGVTSFAVNQRTQEFGIRMALGADRGKIMGMVLKQGGWQLGIGLSLGLVTTGLIAYFTTATLQNFLIGITALDPLTYLAVAALLSAVSFLATFIPARRATKVDPMVALRAE